MPGDSEDPGLIKIRATRPVAKPPQQWDDVYEEYWLDRSRDYLCVRHEQRNYRRPKGNVWRIVEAAQTPDGRWYPRIMCNNDDDGRYFRFELDATGPIEAHVFDWPKNVPKIGDPVMRPMDLP